VIWFARPDHNRIGSIARQLHRSDQPPVVRGDLVAGFDQMPAMDVPTHGFAVV